MSRQKKSKPLRDKALRDFYAQQEAGRRELLPRVEMGFSGRPARELRATRQAEAWPFYSPELKVARHPWPYSSLADPIGDYTEAEEVAVDAHMTKLYNSVT